MSEPEPEPAPKRTGGRPRIIREPGWPAHIPEAVDEEGLPKEVKSLGLPPRPILYTLDQIATILAVDMVSMRQRVYFVGRTTVRRVPKMVAAHNISPPTIVPDWRVSEKELVRFFKECGFRVHRRGLIF